MSVTIPQSIENLLLHVLAAVDALWQPMREGYSTPYASSVFRLRDEYESHGIRWSSSMLGASPTDVERKRAERLLDQVESERLITTRTTLGKRSHVRLTDYGESFIRRRVGWFNLANTLEVVRQMTNRCAVNRLYAETTLLGIHRKSNLDQAKLELLELEYVLLPALSRGVVESTVARKGQVFYHLTGKPFELGSNCLETRMSRKGYWVRMETWADLIQHEFAKLKAQRFNKAVCISLPADLADGDASAPAEQCDTHRELDKPIVVPIGAMQSELSQ